MSVATAPPKEGLIRAARMELRADGEGPARLSGHFAVFNTWTEIRSAWEGNFLERLAPGAARKTIREQGDNIKLLFEHGQDPTVGQKPLGRFTDLREDENGVYYDAELYDANYVNELLPALRDGQFGASFRFNVVREEWNDNPEPSDDNPKGLPERTLKEVRIAEGGPVLWGAYPTATAQARSLTDVFVFRRLMELPPDQIRELRDLWETVELRSRALTLSAIKDGIDAANERGDELSDDKIGDAIRSIVDGSLSSDNDPTLNPKTSTAPDEPEGESRRENEDAETPAIDATSQRVNETRTVRNFLPPFDEPKEKSWIP
jgi:HK97 family phage prohead protease